MEVWVGMPLGWPIHLEVEVGGVGGSVGMGTGVGRGGGPTVAPLTPLPVQFFDPPSSPPSGVFWMG